MMDLYLLQDGTHADPKDVSRGKDGVLRHKNGLAVALYENGEPQSIRADAEYNKNVEAANAGKERGAESDVRAAAVPAAALKNEEPSRQAQGVKHKTTG